MSGRRAQLGAQSAAAALPCLPPLSPGSAPGHQHQQLLLGDRHAQGGGGRGALHRGSPAVEGAGQSRLLQLGEQGSLLMRGERGVRSRGVVARLPMGPQLARRRRRQVLSSQPGTAESHLHADGLGAEGEGGGGAAPQRDHLILQLPAAVGGRVDISLQRGEQAV